LGASLRKEPVIHITLHAGESGTPQAMQDAIRYLKPHRIGHGVKAAQLPELMDMVREQNVLLEVCPTSNYSTGVVKDSSELAGVLKAFLAHQVPFSLNTDGPEMLGICLRDEINTLIEQGILTVDQAIACNEAGMRAAFDGGIAG